VSYDWNDGAARLLKAEIARAGITLAKLAQRLRRMGLEETEASVKNKLYRGTFSMAFFMQCMQALERETVDLDGVMPPNMPRGAALDGDGGGQA